MRRLTRLRRLELTDAPRSWTEEDIDAVAGMTALTCLALGSGSTMLRPLLLHIAAVHGIEFEAAAGSARSGVAVLSQAPGQQQQQQPYGAAGGQGSPSDQRGGASSRKGALQLQQLEVMFDWMQTNNADLLPAVALLSSLTSLKVSRVVAAMRYTAGARWHLKLFCAKSLNQP